MQSIEANLDKFVPEIISSIHTIVSLCKEFSPLSDINYLLRQSGTEVEGIIFDTNNSSWMPIRNVIRILAKIADEVSSCAEQVSEIQINSMIAGCDYFQGHMSYILNREKMNAGNYRWQWTAFPGHNRNYNKFLQFPNSWTAIKTKIKI